MKRLGIAFVMFGALVHVGWLIAQCLAAEPADDTLYGYVEIRQGGVFVVASPLVVLSGYAAPVENLPAIVAFLGQADRTDGC